MSEAKFKMPHERISDLERKVEELQSRVAYLESVINRITDVTRRMETYGGLMAK